MANHYFIRVSRRLQKVTPSCSIVYLNMEQEYIFENSDDFVMWLHQFRDDHFAGKLNILSIRVGDFFKLWNKKRNLPKGMSFLQYVKWVSSLRNRK